MAEEIEKVVIIKIDLDVNEYTKKSVELNKEISEINKAQKELKKSGHELSIEYQQNKEKLTSLNTELRQNNKTIQDITKANQAQSGSNDQLRAQLSLLTSELNKKNQAEGEATEQTIEQQKQVLALTDQLKKNESAVGDNRRNVGNYSSALKDLKAELKATKSEMIGIASASGVDSKEFQEASEKAGKLQDQINDVNDATKAMASGSGLEKFSNTLGLVGKDLMNLDFAGASEKAKGLGAIAKSISFKDTIAGAKSFIVTIYEVGASLMALPIFWVVAGIALIASAFYLASKETQENAQKQVDALDSVINRYSRLYDIQARLGKASGQNVEEIEMKKLQLVRKGTAMQIAVLEKLQATQAGLNDDQKKMLDELRIKQLENIADIGEANINSIKKQGADKIKAFQEDAKLTAEVRAKRTKEALEDLAEQRRLNEERLAENKKYMLQIQDQRVEMIRDDETREQAKLALDHQRRIQEITESKADNDVKFDALLSQQELYEKNNKDIRDKYDAIRKADFDKQIADQLNKVKADAKAMSDLNADPTFSPKLKEKFELIDKTNKDIVKSAQEREASIKRLEQESFEATKTAVDGIAQIRANQREQEIIDIEEETKIKIDNLQAQADAGIITQDDFQTKSNRIKMDAQKQEAIIRKKQFEESKKIALIQVAIKTAQGVMTAFNATTPYEIGAYVALALATGALEASIIQSQPTPAFAGGGKAVSGKRISSSDGKSISRSNGDNLLATIKTGEVILNERQQRMLGGDRTFKKIGVPGFASGGLADGGLFANSLSSGIDEQIFAQNQTRQILESLPQSVVYVESISQKTNDVAEVEARANI